MREAVLDSFPEGTTCSTPMGGYYLWVEMPRGYDSMALYAAILRALENHRYPNTWQQLMLRAMSADHSWASSARRYVEIYRRAIATRSDRPPRETYIKGAQ